MHNSLVLPMLLASLAACATAPRAALPPKLPPTEAEPHYAATLGDAQGLLDDMRAGADGCSWDGSWQGTFPIEGVGMTGNAWTDQLTLRLVFAGSSAGVFSVEQGRWMQVFPWRFQFHCRGPSAVLFGFNEGGDRDGPWIESWSLAITRVDDDHLLLRWMRMVNNTELALAAKASKFSSQGGGVLTRLKPSEADLKICLPTANDALGEVMTRFCDCGAGEACEYEAVLLDKEGGDKAQIKLLHERACKLGLKTACEVK